MQNTGFGNKPKALMCFLCGREFGTNSLEIHMKQCEKKNNKNSIPQQYNQVFDKIKSGNKLSNNEYEQFNNNANDEYKDKTLVGCLNCGRKFLPDRLEVHLRSCKGEGVKFKLKNEAKSSQGVPKLSIKGNLGKSVDVSALNKENTSTKLFEEKMLGQLKSEAKETKKSTSVNPLSKSLVLPSIKPKGPVCLVCYVCGREFGKHSIEIHLEKCMEKKVQEDLSKGIPKKQIVTPDPPDELIAILDKLQLKEEIPYEEIAAYNQIAQEWYKNLSMRQCEKCGRRFASDRLDVHLKSCNPEQMNKPNSNKTGMATRPKMHMCPLCGREFGSMSLDIHIKTCKIKFDRDQEQLPYNQRKSAEDLIEKFKKMEANIKSNGNYNIDNFNGEAFKMFNEEALVPCDLCGRTFLPDRLAVHKRSCKGPRK